MKSINLMKNVGQFTPPPPKSSSPTYPQMVCMIYPQIIFGDLPPLHKSSSLTYPQIVCMIYPQIVFGDLPPPEIVKSDLPSNRLYNLPSNCLW